MALPGITNVGAEGIAEIERLQQHLHRHALGVMVLAEITNAATEGVIAAAVEFEFGMAREEDVLEGVIGIFRIDFVEAMPKRLEHGQAARLLAFAIAQEIMIEVLVVPDFVVADLRG